MYESPKSGLKNVVVEPIDNIAIDRGNSDKGDYIGNLSRPDTDLRCVTRSDAAHLDILLPAHCGACTYCSFIIFRVLFKIGTASEGFADRGYKL